MNSKVYDEVLIHGDMDNPVDVGGAVARDDGGTQPVQARPQPEDSFKRGGNNCFFLNCNL